MTLSETFLMSTFIHAFFFVSSTGFGYRVKCCDISQPLSPVALGTHFLSHRHGKNHMILWEYVFMKNVSVFSVSVECGDENIFTSRDI